MKLYLAVIAAATALATSPAWASDGESALSLSLSYGTYTVGEDSPSGGVLGVEYQRGISDALAWRVSGGGGVYYSGAGASMSGHLVAGLSYTFDVLRYVPYAHLGVGGIALRDGAGSITSSALLELGVGLDILHSRSFSYGVLIAFESVIQQTAFFTAGARMAWRWGFF